jgi:putative redox protein
MARVTWVKDRTFLGVDDNGRAAVMSSGGDGPGVSPMQMLLLGLGGCAMVDVLLILQKQRQTVTDVDVVIDGVRGEEGARPWKTIDMHFVVSGENLDDAKVERAIDLSLEKYCGAFATLSASAQISHSYEVCAVGTSAERA